MGYNLREIGSLIKAAAGTDKIMPIVLLECNIVSVNEDERTCIVDSIGDNSQIENLEARFEIEVEDGVTEVPTVGSSVIVAFSDYTQPFVIRSTDLSKFSIYITNQGYVIQEGGQTFNDGKYGGIPIVKSEYEGESEKGLLKKINQLEEKLNEINKRLDSFINQHLVPNWIVAPNDGGLALQTKITSWVATPNGLPVSDITPITSEDDISNQNINHGKSIVN